MKNNVLAIIENLKNLDLSNYPKEEILALLDQVGKIGHVVVTFHPGKDVMRARPNYNGERFERKSDYSYKPQEFNDLYQRASTPLRTMFYATAIPDDLKPGELDNMRVIGLSETIPMLRDLNSIGFQKISFGRWVVKEDLRLLAVVQNDNFSKMSSYTQELANAYRQFLAKAPRDLIEKSRLFTTFMANEFSKISINGDYDYMISAHFTEQIVKLGLDGVLYPSVRVGGMGFNIAITPEATDKLALHVAGECSIYKYKEQTVLGNDAIVQLNGDEEEFKLIEIERQERECLAKLGLNSIDELL